MIKVSDYRCLDDFLQVLNAQLLSDTWLVVVSVELDDAMYFNVVTACHVIYTSIMMKLQIGTMCGHT